MILCTFDLGQRTTLNIHTYGTLDYLRLQAAKWMNMPMSWVRLKYRGKLIPDNGIVGDVLHGVRALVRVSVNGRQYADDLGI